MKALWLLLVRAALIVATLSTCRVVRAEDHAAAVDEVPTAAALALDIDALARKAEGLIQVVLAHHVDPPTRQEMWLAGTRALFENVPGQSPARLGTRVSQITKPEEFRDFLKDAWFQELTPEQRRTALAAPRLTAAFLDGLLRRVPQAQVLSASEGLAREQTAANYYVGTGILPTFNESEGYTAIGALVRGGPMERAGGREGDLITKVGERDTRNLPVAEVIELLRGAEGTTVTLQLRSRVGTAEPRTLTVTRGPVFRDAVEGLTQDRDGKWQFRIEPYLPIGYVKCRQINGSAVHELRRLEREFRDDGVAAVILDFRSTTASDVHQAVLLADALLDGGLIGRLRWANGRVQEFHADRECLFRGWPKVVLIDGTTSGGAEWIAAALQGNRTCVIMGESSAGSELSRSNVPVPGENLSVQLPTGFFERRNRNPLQKPESLVRVGENTGPAELLPGAVTPDQIVPAPTAATVPGVPANDLRRLRAQRAQTGVVGKGGKDIVIAAAVQELRDQIESAGSAPK